MIVTALSELLIDMNYIFVFHIFMMRYWISRRHKDSESVKIIAIFVAICYYSFKKENGNSSKWHSPNG